MKQDVDETLKVSHLELLRLASTHSDQEAWAEFQQGLEETVLTWLHEHPFSHAACRVHGEHHFAAQAFEQLQQAVFKGQVTCETFSEVLLYLRASLNGSILETLRVCSHPGAVSSPWPDGEEHLGGNEFWDRLQSLLSSERERQLAYLLYHCGMNLTEIVRYCPQEWSDIREVARLRRVILEPFMHRLNYEAT